MQYKGDSNDSIFKNREREPRCHNSPQYVIKPVVGAAIWIDLDDFKTVGPRLKTGNLDCKKFAANWLRPLMHDAIINKYNQFKHQEAFVTDKSNTLKQHEAGVRS
jgi:hypothetical protein